MIERFSTIENITTGELTKVNEVRIYLRVITIADLAHSNGKYIPDDMLDGEWQYGSDLKWLEQPLPPKRHWALFRRCLKRTFCSKVPQYQKASYSLELDKPLGDWLKVRRHSWYDCYRTENSLVYREDQGNELREFTPDENGLYNF